MTNTADATLQSWLRHRVHDGMTAQGWLQVQLASYTGMTQKHISQMLTGRVDGSVIAWDNMLRAVDRVPQVSITERERFLSSVVTPAEHARRFPRQYLP